MIINFCNSILFDKIRSAFFIDPVAIAVLSILQETNFGCCMRHLGALEKGETTGDEFVSIEGREV